MFLGSTIKKAFNHFGFTVSRGSPLRQQNCFTQHEITVLFDVGANSGQFGLDLRSDGYSGKIISFEPLIEAHKQLLVNSNSDSNWIIAPPCALGETAKDSIINVAKNSWSSSILEMLPAHSEAEMNSIYVDRQSTHVSTLDIEFQKYVSKNEKVGLKIDTQGYEREVLLGGIQFLKIAKVVQLELSIVPLYKESELYPYFFELFASKGFELWNIVPGFRNPLTGRLLQFDAIFVKV